MPLARISPAIEAPDSSQLSSTEPRVMCTHCRETFQSIDPPERLGGGSLCPSCIENVFTEHCYDCDCHTTPANSHSRADGASICRYCREHHYWCCRHCSVLIDTGDTCGSERCDEEQAAATLIHEWSYRPTPCFRGDGPVHLGLELELNVPRGSRKTAARQIDETLGALAYLKHDGSINHGFEIVTHPMSYAWAMRNFPWHILGTLDDIGCDGDGVGMHVHVSRTAFDGPVHIYRWLKFLYRNSDALISLARRHSDEYASFTSAGRTRAKFYAKGATGPRYEAVNTQNSDTLEVRIFASTVQPRQVQAALGLVAASVEYTRTLTIREIRCGGWRWTAFSDWLEHHPEYTPLHDEMEDLACAC